MINKTNNTIKCDNCLLSITINKEKLKKWCTRQHVDRFDTVNKHYCNKCSNQLGFYTNGVIMY